MGPKSAAHSVVGIPDRQAALLLNERTITHKLAVQLQEHFKGWDVDCEYNKDHDVKKMLPLPQKQNIKGNDIHARTVFPDIIIHKRGTGSNLVVIEVKKSTNPEGDEWDLAKLAAFRRVLRYRVTVFNRFTPTGDAEVSFP